jgi:hypothetical protein
LEEQIYPMMKQKIDENKTKELLNILLLLEEDKEKTLHHLLKFEAENPSEYYYLHLMDLLYYDEDLLDCDAAHLILNRFKEIKFCDIEHFARSYIQSISERVEKNFFFDSYDAMEVYLENNPKSTNLLLIMLDEITKLHFSLKVLQTVLRFIPLVTFDSNVTKFYNSLIFFLFENGDDWGFLNLYFICVDDKLHDENNFKFKFQVFYPEIKSILLEGEFSENYLNFFGVIYKIIPQEDALKIFEKIANEFKISEKHHDIIFDFIYYLDLKSYNHEEFIKR